MPKLTKVIEINITPEQFLDNCTADELKEIDLLIQSPRYYNKINPSIGFQSQKQQKKHRQLIELQPKVVESLNP